MIPVFIIGAFALTFLLLQYIQQTYYHRKRARSLHCQPVARINYEYFGIPNYLRLSRAAQEKRILEYQAQRFEEVGKNTFALKILGKGVVATREPENVKALLATQFQDFCLGDRHQQFHPFLGDGIFTLDGKGWSSARALLRPQFAKDQVTLYTHSPLSLSVSTTSNRISLLL